MDWFIGVIVCMMLVGAIGIVVGTLALSRSNKAVSGVVNSGKYLIAYSYSKKVRGGNSVSGFGNYITEVDITDAESLNKVTDEINKAFYDGKAVVVIMNVLVM
jgi:hypothetical protein